MLARRIMAAAEWRTGTETLERTEAMMAASFREQAVYEISIV
jgi:hypothetical protein